MTVEQFQAADFIIQRATLEGRVFLAIYTDFKKSGGNGDVVKGTAEYLRHSGLIEIVDKKGIITYKLTPKGIRLQTTGKGYAHFLEQESEKQRIQEEKEKRDNIHKDLQIQDLETKLTVMNQEQLQFWNRQKWQFWLTLMLAGAGFVLGIINFIKSMIIQ